MQDRQHYSDDSGAGRRHHRHHHHHHHHHSHHRSPLKKRMMIFVPVFIAFVILCGGVWFYTSLKKQKSYHVTASNSSDVGSGYRNITYSGQEYQYNNLVTAVLFIGIDSTGTIEETGYTQAPRADSINLIIMDEKNDRMTIMALNRDTMTEIHRYTLSGKDRGTYTTHLGYAYTYGNGTEVSCENVCQAVSDLLGGIPVTEYVAANVSSLSYVCDLAGDVTVTVPNDDLAEEYPEFKKGAQAVIDKTNIEAYLRSRDTGEDFSNEGRLERQKSYMTAFVECFKTRISEDLSGTWEDVERADEYILTSITKNKYLTLANLLNDLDYSESNYYSPEGQDELGDLHDEFYVDEDALREKVIELFYVAV